MTEVKGNKPKFEGEDEDLEEDTGLPPLESNNTMKVDPENPETCPEDQVSKGRVSGPRLHSKTVLGDFFLIEDPKTIKMRKNSSRIAYQLHAKSFGSDENLLSKDEFSLYSRDYVNPAGVPASSIDSIETPHCQTLAPKDLSLSFRYKGSEILNESPDFSDRSQGQGEAAESDLGRNSSVLKEDKRNPGLMKRVSNEPLPVPQPEFSISAYAPESQLMKMAYFRKKRQQAKHLLDHEIVYSIAETWDLNSSSIEDIFRQPPSLPVPAPADTGAFYYVDKEETVEEIEGEKSNLQENNSENKSRKRLFQLFETLSVRFTSKDAYLQLMPLASQTVNAVMVRSMQTACATGESVAGDWSGKDVRKVTTDEEKAVDITRLNMFRYILWKPGLLGKIQKLQYPFLVLVSSLSFNIVMIVCVVCNTVVLALNHYGIDAEENNILDNLNLAFTVIFTIEMVLKWIGLGLLGYYRVNMNVFDCIVVILSLVELAFSSGAGLNAFRAIRVFRVFRVLRVVRLFRYLRYMHKIVHLLGQSLSNFIYMGLLLALFLIVFTLLGMQLYGGEFNFPDGQPRANFDNFHFAFLATFQVLTQENWYGLLYSGMRTYQGNYGAIYFVIWCFFGNYILLNLFLAILLDSMSQLSTEDELADDEIQELDVESDSTLSRQRTSANFNRRKQKQINNILKQIEAIKEEQSLESASNSIDAMLGSKNDKPLFTGNECSRSLFILPKTSRIRILCHRITSHPRFEWLMLLVIIFSSLKLIWETYLINEPADSTKVLVSNYMDIIITSIFALECVLKIISLGFIIDKGTYLRDWWNVLDFFIVIFSLLDLSLTNINLSVIKVFRLLRALRPLRFISHNKSMRIIVNALLESFGAIANVSIGFLIVCLIFMILGVSLLSGKMYNCSNPSILVQADCEYHGYNWANSPYHFDSVIAAYNTLFDQTSQENWPDTMYNAMNAVGEGQGMQLNAYPSIAYFFIVFMCLGNIFFLNLMLGVMFDKFERAKQSNTSISALLLKNDQRRWVEMMKYVIRTKRVTQVAPITNISRLFVIRIIEHWTFGTFVMICIVANMITMALDYDEASPSYKSALEDINLGFTAVFVIEACLKLYGLGSNYFKDRWNDFDFFVVAASIIDICLSMTIFNSSSGKILAIGPQLARVLRILRVLRLVRLAKRLQILDDIVGTMALALPAIVNVSALLVLVFMIYGVLGVYLFHEYSSGIILDDYNNFRNFGFAALYLIRSSTGEDYNYSMLDCSVGSNGIAAHFFFETFVCITTFIMYNMFVMVMLQEYENYHDNPDNNSFNLYKLLLVQFNTSWSKAISGDNKTRVDMESLILFAYEMGPILEITPEMNRYEVKKHLGHLGLVTDEQGFIYYHDALFKVMRMKYGIRQRPKNKVHRKLLEKEEIIHAKKLKKLVQVEKLRSVANLMHGSHGAKGEMQFYDLIAIKSIFRSWKKYAKNKKARSDVSDTPAMSLNYPGPNSPKSLVEEESDPASAESERKKELEAVEKKEEEKVTLQLPVVTSDMPTARGEVRDGSAPNASL